MDKKKDKPIEKKLEDWMKTQGYPLEMQVAKEFREAGFYVRSSEHYKDFESEKYREIDIVASILSNIDNSFITQIIFPIECKLSHDKPWVLLTSASEFPKWTPLFGLYSNYSSYFFSQITRSPVLYKRLQELPLLSQQRIAHGLIQAFTKKIDVAYEAINCAVKAGVAFAKHTDLLPDVSQNVSRLKAFFTFVLPVVVFDNDLFDYSLDENGETHLRRTDMGVMLWKGYIPTNSIPYLYIIPKSKMSNFILKAKQLSDEFLSITDELKDVLSSVAKIEYEYRHKNKHDVDGSAS